MNPLDIFLQTGRLPPVEREKALTAIERFHAEVLDSDRMQMMAVIGEAGVGKSALIDRAIERLEGAGDVVLRLRAWSEGTGALGEQIREALRRSPQSELLLRGGVEPTLPAALAALRRIIRLRPTLLVIEDVHLLSGEPLAELARTFEALEEEPIGVVITGRSLPTTVEGVVLPWLEERLRLNGFDREETERLWQTLTGGPPELEVLDAVLDATHGNALALRSGLRAALRSIDRQGLIRRDGARTRISTEPLLAELHRQVDLLADGMIAHMSAEERAAAARIALLGEVFDPATALCLPNVSRERVDALVARGTLAPAVAPASPLLPAQHPSSTPLAFTHSLLHEALRRHAVEDPATVAAVLEIVKRGEVLLSLAPVWYLRTAPLGALPADLLRSAALGLGTVATALRTGVHHAVAGEVLDVARRLARGAQSAEENPEASEALDRTLAILGAEMQSAPLHTPEFRGEIETLLTMTAAPSDIERAGARIDALRFLHAINYRGDYPRFDVAVSREIDHEVELLLERYPELRLSTHYINYLATVAQTGSLDEEMLNNVAREASAILSTPNLPAERRQLVVRDIYPYLLRQCNTPQERDERLRMIEELERIDASANPRTRSRIVQFHMVVGNYNVALPMIDDAERQFRLAGLWPQRCNVRLDRVRILVARDAPLERCEQEADALIAAAPNELREQTRRFCGLHLAITALLCGEAATAARWTGRYAAPELLAPYERAMILLDAGAEDSGLVAETEGSENFNPLYGAIALAAGIEPQAGWLAELQASLKRPIVEIGQALARHAYMCLLRRACQRYGEGVLAEHELHPLPAIENLLEWTATCTMPAFGRSLLPLAEEFGLGVRAARAWRGRFNEGRGRADGVLTSNRVQIRICGTIEAIPPDGEPVPVRGGRLRTVLGLMVAQQMLREPLDPREFRYIAAGSDSGLDAENARKTMNAAVVRLRDLIGEETIDTSGSMPVLDTERVSIDLLDADTELRSARKALRGGKLQRAVRGVRRTLALTRGEPPFPALYEEFFEALREDFEARLRGVAADVVARLLEENDPAGAEELASLALHYMPEDEEMGEMRATALERLGRRADAERTRMSARHEEMLGDD